jgi:hypothetical protein
LITFFIHLIAGQIDPINPMLETSLSVEKSSQIVGAWHIVTIILLGTSYVLLSAGFGKQYATNYEMIKSIGYIYLICCLPFIITGFHYGLLVPQWVLLLPIGVSTVLGLNKTRKNA